MASFLDDDTEDMVGDIITIEIDKTFAEIAKKI
jgi:predicted O-methyltransferase YrrM